MVAVLVAAFCGNEGPQQWLDFFLVRIVARCTSYVLA